MLLRADPRLSELGFPPELVEVWGKGADFNDLLQVKKPTWRTPATDGETIGYRGIEVHYEACRPGHWVIHCELWPRQGKSSKAAAHRLDDLLKLKGFITEGIRTLGAELGWPERLGAHLKRLRGNPTDPSSLIVYTFDLPESTRDSPEEFVQHIVPIVVETAPTIDEVMHEQNVD